MNRVTVEIRQIDAWQFPNGGWYWNDSIVLDTLEFDADESFIVQFSNWLTEHVSQLAYNDSEYYITMQDDAVIEVYEIATDRPVLAACFTEY